MVPCRCHMIAAIQTLCQMPLSRCRMADSA
jgi:hypothetical protein